MMSRKNTSSRDWSAAISHAFSSKQQKFHNGVILFNSGEFFKAHEVWEEIWLGATEPDKTFLQGLIQLAAAFHHYSRGNRTGGQSLAETALAKLEIFSGNYWGINLATLRVAARGWLDAPLNHPQCVPVPAPNIQIL
jgi:uncharacterized protein